MLIENLWHDLMNERYMQVWYYDGPSPKNGPRMVALLDELNRHGFNRHLRVI